MEKKLLDLFLYVKSSFYGNAFYKPFLTPSEETLLKNFVKKTTGWNEDSYWNFILFSFERRKDQSTPHAISLSWIFGEKSLQAWRNRSEKWVYFVDQFKSKYRLVNPLKESSKVISEEYMETQRSKWVNTARGFLNCSSFGKMIYNQMSPSCSGCEYKKICAGG